MVKKDYQPGDRVYRVEGGIRLNIISTGQPLMGTVKHVYPGSLFVEWDTLKGSEMWHGFSSVAPA